MNERISFEVNELFESLGSYGHAKSWAEARANFGIKFDDPLPATGYGIPHQKIEDDVDWKIDRAIANGADWETLKELYPSHNAIVSSFKIAPRKVRQFNAENHISTLLNVIDQRTEDIKEFVGGYKANRHEFVPVLRSIVSGDFSLREIATKVGWTKDVVFKIFNKLRDFLRANKYPEIVCKCGVALADHNGMCHLRFVRSVGRHSIVKMWHDSTPNTGHVTLGRSFDSFHVSRIRNG